MWWIEVDEWWVVSAFHGRRWSWVVGLVLHSHYRSQLMLHDNCMSSKYMMGMKIRIRRL
jgi:hypothetical protein